MAKCNLGKLRKINLELTKKKIREDVNEDNLICQSANCIHDMDRVANILSKRLREWYSLYNPEFEKSISNNKKFCELINKQPKKQPLKEIGAESSMGGELGKTDLEPILGLAKEILSLYNYRERAEKYLEELMEKYCPNLKEVSGSIIGAKLIEHTGSLKKLVMMPASTVQILGAEKALFRHMKTGARPPKFGIIHDHQFIQQTKKAQQGKRARALADKISLAVKMDYFKGEFIAKKLKKELEEKFK
ncbi:hypothetical protein GF323_06690 [Candidatus Woesearchaeota archaeon]|nr:hypothetical protein [Candidatus Woesearchaeota archaeon]